MKEIYKNEFGKKLIRETVEAIYSNCPLSLQEKLYRI